MIPTGKLVRNANKAVITVHVSCNKMLIYNTDSRVQIMYIFPLLFNNSFATTGLCISCATAQNVPPTVEHGCNL